MKIFFSLIILTAICSCSNLTKSKSNKKYKTVDTYSDEVEREFSLIESEEASASRYYRELRRRDWDNYKKGSNTSSRYHKITPKKPTKRTKKRVTQKIKKQTPTYTQEQIKEFQIEIGQNLSYYCMKNRKNKRFSNKEDCLAYTKDTLLKCEQRYQRQYGRVITKCLKKSLGI